MDAEYFRHRAALIRAALAECADQRLAGLLEGLAQDFEKQAKRHKSRYAPGESATVTGIYAQMNAKGARTGSRIRAGAGETLPPAPPGFTWLFIRRQE